MNRSLLQLACAAAFGALAVSAQAQYTQSPAAQPSSPAASTPSTSSSSSSMSSGTSAATKTQAEADFKAAQAKCDALTGSAKTTCLSDAKAAYDRAIASDATMPNADVPASTPGATGSGASTSQGNVSKPKQ